MPTEKPRNKKNQDNKNRPYTKMDGNYFYLVIKVSSTTCGTESKEIKFTPDFSKYPIFKPLLVSLGGSKNQNSGVYY